MVGFVIVRFYLKLFVHRSTTRFGFGNLISTYSIYTNSSPCSAKRTIALFRPSIAIKVRRRCKVHCRLTQYSRGLISTLTKIYPHKKIGTAFFSRATSRKLRIGALRGKSSRVSGTLIGSRSRVLYFIGARRRPSITLGNYLYVERNFIFRTVLLYQIVRNICSKLAGIRIVIISNTRIRYIYTCSRVF